MPLGFGPLDLGYTLFNKEAWSKSARDARRNALLAAEDARDMTKRRQEIELSADADKQRQLAIIRETAAQNETAAINAEKRRKAMEDEARERARQGIVTGRMEELNEQRRATGAGLPQAAMGPVAEAFARSALQKADAAKTLGNTVESEISFGSLPRARSLQRTKVATDEMGETSKQSDILDKEALRAEELKEKQARLKAGIAKFAMLTEQPLLDTPGGASLIGQREKLQAEEALWNNLLDDGKNGTAKPTKIPLDAPFLKGAISTPQTVNNEINTTPAQLPQPALNNQGAPASTAVAPGAIAAEGEKDMAERLFDFFKNMKFSRPEEIIPVPTPKR